MRHFPLSRELSNVCFGLFVDLKGAEVATTCGFVKRDIGCSAVFPVLSEST